MVKRQLIEGGTLLTVDCHDRVLLGDLYFENDCIKTIYPKNTTPFLKNVERIDASGCYVMPGLIQAHVHLCQTLFRGLAEAIAFRYSIAAS